MCMNKRLIRGPSFAERFGWQTCWRDRGKLLIVRWGSLRRIWQICSVLWILNVHGNLITSFTEAINYCFPDVSLQLKMMNDTLNLDVGFIRRLWRRFHSNSWVIIASFIRLLINCNVLFLFSWDMKFYVQKQCIDINIKPFWVDWRILCADFFIFYIRFSHFNIYLCFVPRSNR